MTKEHFQGLIVRYAVATAGLVLVALGVAISLKSNLGTAPVSCPPAFLNLRWEAVSVGTFTWMMHIVFILLQVLLLRRKFKLAFLMQIPAAFVFGYLCDAAIWLVRDLVVPNYAVQMILSLISVVLTAIGIRIEVAADAWMLAGDKTTAVLSDVSGVRFSTVKILFDVFLVILSALFGWVAFRNLTGDGSQVVIREGTLILAFCTGLCMRLTDPLVDRVLRPLLKNFHD